jgi:purine-binding chemotaxis protein CheW
MDITTLLQNPATRKILEERAQALALQEALTDGDQGEELLIFRLGDGCYSIPVAFVREVQPLGDYTRLPSAPAFVVGLVNVRGRLLSALDLRPLLEMPQTPPDASAFLLIVTGDGMEVGLLADTIVEIRHASADLSPTPSASAGQAVSWVRGVDATMSLLIDPALFLHDPRLTVNDVIE